ncbi:MAG: toll/interleukin-1 receptor domain-containing protein [Hyphomicrobiales bacterium]|nr:toll/interleukin-1 receptor domain-containing protein [Hyphomicrobiales bacterium]
MKLTTRSHWRSWSARIFLSHSSANNAEAIALRDWLAAEGWDDLFLDLDPQRGIVAGERWERALNEAANRCEAVLFLVSKAWLASAWCLKEFHLAAKPNKRMFGVLVEDLSVAELPAEVTATWQLVDLASGSDHQMFRAVLPDGSEAHVTWSKSGLARLKGGLTRAARRRDRRQPAFAAAIHPATRRASRPTPSTMVDETAY